MLSWSNNYKIILNMKQKDIQTQNLYKRPFKYALWSTVVIMIFVSLRLMIGERVGTTGEIFLRFILAWPFVFVCVYLMFLLYLYFNPDADKRRR